jgi:sugar lactone lactonase YvrE
MRVLDTVTRLYYLLRGLGGLVLIGGVMGCVPAPRSTPQPDRVTPTIAPAADALYGTPPAKSPNGNSNMTRLIVAPDGAVWYSFGSYDWNHLDGGGLSRYDRGQVTHFSVDDGLPGNNIQALRVAPDGTVWVGALCGIARYADARWQLVNELADCQSVGGTVIDFAFTPDGSVWVGTTQGVGRFYNQQWTRYSNLAGFLVTTRDGSVWATGLDGDGLYLARFNGSTWIKVEQPLKGNLVYDSDGSLWLAEQDFEHGNSRLTRFDGQNWQTISIPTMDWFNVAIAPDGTPWAVTREGVARFNGTQWIFDTSVNSDFTHLAFAPDGTLWLGGRGGHLAHYQPTANQLTIVATPLPTPTPLPTFTPDPDVTARPIGPAPSPSVTPIPQWPVTSLVVTPDGTVWYSFGNYDFYPRRGGIVREIQGQQTHFMPEASVQLLKVAPDGSVWAGAGCSLMRYANQGWQPVIENCDKLQGNIYDLAFTADGATWIAAGFKLARYQNGEWTIIDRLINSVAVAADGPLWAAGWEGTQGSQYVARFDGTQWTIVERAAVRQLLAIADGSVWGIKADNSLGRYAGANSQTFTDLPFDHIDDWVNTPDGKMWAITDRGVVRFDGAQWQRASNLPEDITQIAFAPDGSMWAGKRAGTVSRVDPATFRFAAVSPRATATPPAGAPLLPLSTPTPTTPPSPQPRFSNGIDFATEPNRAKTQRVFPTGTRQIFALWNYANMTPQQRVRREWYRDNVLWLVRDETWDYTRYGRDGTLQDVSVHDFESGLQAGLYTLRLYIDDQPQAAFENYGPISFRVEGRPLDPAPSPDGRHIALVRDPRVLTVQDADGTQRELLTADEISSLAWLPDGRHLIYSNRLRAHQLLDAGSIGVQDELWIVDMVTGDKHPLGTAAENLHTPSVSPDGRYIAVLSGTGWFDACLVDLSLAIVELDNHWQRTAIYRLADFAGLPRSDADDLGAYPVAVTGAALPGVWLNSSQFEVNVQFTCRPDNPAGVYTLDLRTQTARKTATLEEH